MTDGQTEKAKITVGQDGDEIVLPLYTEEISVFKRVVPKTFVHVSRTTDAHEEIVNELLARERAEVERVAIGKPVKARPLVCEEGDTIIIPVVEEVATVERHLILKEEIRIRRIRSEERYQERVVLRKQETVIKQMVAEPTE